MKVAVIGGGIVGVSIAYHLSQAGISDIVLFEREKMLGMGVTQYCSGGVRSQFTTSINVQFSKESIGDFRSLAQTIGYQQCGYLILDAGSDSLPRVKMQNDLGVASEYLSVDKLKQRFPFISAEGIKSASFFGEDGIADPASLIEHWHKQAVKNGVKFEFEASVEKLVEESGRVSGVSVGGNVGRYEVVALAAGIQSVELAKTIGIDIPILKRRKYVFMVEGLKIKHPLIMEIPTGWYIKPEGEDALIGMSGWEEKQDYEKKDESLQETLAATVKRIPQAENVHLKKTLSSMSDETPDKHAIIDNSHPGLIIATGFSGHGFMHSPATGRIVASLVKGEKPAIDISALALKRKLNKELVAI
ncbi:FAD-binding oxidoreductase [Candidatus Saganbacteria bacterium]|nr:FAD-binding oxidoreductase [Candidatus Saganbacteria bacterium]